MGGGASVSESVGNQGQMAQALKIGLETLDLNQTVLFTLYRRVVLPIDGFVFWVRAELLRPGSLINTFVPNSVTPNQISVVDKGPLQFEAKGSLHQTTVNKQDPAESFSVNRMIFTSEQRVNDLTEVAPNSMYLAKTDNQRYAFSSRSMWYKQADLYHYSGDAVYPTMASQIIDNIADLDLQSVVVSNSLPIWLGLNQFFPVYPSYLVPDNVKPPYASVHIGDDDTYPMQSGATHDSTGSRWQLARDTVRVVTYGVRNDTIMDWLDYVNDFTLANPDVLGVMNSPIPRDAKRWQTEISALAQRKVVTFDASYYQSRIKDVSLQLIREAFIDEFLPAPYSGIPGSGTIGYLTIGRGSIGIELVP